MPRLAALILALFFLPVVAAAALLAPVFQDHMVLQRATPLRLWGSAAAGSQVVVEFAGQRQAVTAAADGRWTAQLAALPASSQARDLVVTAGTRVCLHDVLIGEVWLAAGQSNMEFPLANEAHASAALAQADQPALRLLNLTYAGQNVFARPFTAEILQRLEPDTFYRGTWQACAPTSARSFSAVAYYFARDIQAALQVPVGIINLAVGGSPTEAWIRPAALQDDPALRPMLAGNWLDNPVLDEWCRQRGRENLGAATTLPAGSASPNHPFKPGFLWNAGLAPLAGFPLRGVIWYQGESNSLSLRRVQQHERLFPLLVADWRSQWGRGDFPFLYCQLSSIGTAGGYHSEYWPEFRDSQRRMLAQIPQSGMAITSDLGHPTNVHPRNKQDVGRSLALWALAQTYGQDVVYCGPLAQSVRRAGAALVVTFDHATGDLQTSDGQPPASFELAAADGRFHPATAQLTANTAIITHPEIPHPLHVRYAWQPFSLGNLTNHASLPASTFQLTITE